MRSQKTTIDILLILSFALLLITVFGGTVPGKAQSDRVAIKGYDTVAYFKAGKAIKGTGSLNHPWHNMTWYFSSKENKALFVKSPQEYAPQYDGYCAWAMSEGRKAQTDPEVWKIVRGKLYLNCSRAAFKKWSANIPGNIKKADANWVKYKNK